jgi:beta-phosphoglucomutase
MKLNGKVTANCLGPVKAIIFDCDGTLVDSEHAYYLALKKALNKFGADVSPEEYSCFVGISTGLNEDFISEKTGSQHVQAVLDEALANYYQHQAEGLDTIKHTFDFLHALTEKKEALGLKVGLASAASRRDILVNLQGVGIESFFDVILSGKDDLHDHYFDPEGINKPKPYVYLHAAKVLGLEASDCIAIEDSYTGVVAGAEAGCFTVAIPNYFTLGHDLTRAHLTMESFKDMTVEGFLKVVNDLRANLSDEQ